MGFDKAKFLVRFVSEAREHIISLREGLLALEKHPDDTDSLNSVFRMAHTIKGASKMMKLTPISSVAHKLEDLMDALRQGKIHPGQDLSDLLFKGVAEIERMLDETDAGKEITEISAEFFEKLEAAAKGETPPPTPPPAPPRNGEG
ncbi:MAG TPA: hybrid sensor histidine kinase/response regulator, partial [Desulfobacteraceae bacterium]|nr:hybrid sensor histidine kinase/response regulator [Desulfobacteraceae bacterium]